jgi:large subunit ribosomal protein L4
MFKQKGTGRARHGSYAAPIFVGGGIAHGPSGEQNYRLKMPENMRKVALLGALSAKAAKDEIKVITGASEASGKTKEAALMWKKLANKAKTLIITSGSLANFNRATKNLIRVDIANSATLNTYEVLAHKELVVTKEAIEELKKHYS